MAVPPFLHLLLHRRPNLRRAEAPHAKPSSAIHQAGMLPLRRPQGETPGSALPHRPQLSLLRQSPDSWHLRQSRVGEALPVWNSRACSRPPWWHWGPFLFFIWFISWYFYNLVDFVGDHCEWWTCFAFFLCLLCIICMN